MANLESRVTGNIQSLIMMLISKGVTQISLPKMVLFVNREFGIQMDNNQLSEILTQIPSVAGVEGGIVSLSQGGEETEKDVQDNVHDDAVDQAAEKLTSESFNLNNYKSLENIKVGDIIESSTIKLNETDKDYFKHLGAKKAKANYIVTEICPSKTINESYIRCKIDGQSIFIDIPLESL